MVGRVPRRGGVGESVCGVDGKFKVVEEEIGESGIGEGEGGIVEGEGGGSDGGIVEGEDVGPDDEESLGWSCNGAGIGSMSTWEKGVGKLEDGDCAAEVSE